MVFDVLYGTLINLTALTQVFPLLISPLSDSQVVRIFLSIKLIAFLLPEYYVSILAKGKYIVNLPL